MRWFWIDRFTEFVSGRYAVAIKNVSLAEEQLDGYQPGYPIMPHSLIVEGLAQTGGILVAQVGDFTKRVVLAKVSNAVFHDVATPGDTLTYKATIQNVQPGGSMVKGTSHIGDKLQAEIELFFGHLEGDRFDQVELFEPSTLLGMLQIWRLFEVGRYDDGTPLKIPAHMLPANDN